MKGGSLEGPEFAKSERSQRKTETAMFLTNTGKKKTKQHNMFIVHEMAFRLPAEFSVSSGGFPFSRLNFWEFWHFSFLFLGVFEGISGSSGIFSFLFWCVFEGFCGNSEIYPFLFWWDGIFRIFKISFSLCP